jgi:hypothetical protein
MHVISSAAGVVGGALAVGMPHDADDEADAGLVESGERVIEVNGDAGGDAGCQAQYPVLSAAAGEVTGIAAGDDGLPVVIGLFIWAQIDGQRQCSFVTATRVGRPAFRSTKTSEAACMHAAVSEWPTAARRRFRGGYHGA